MERRKLGCLTGGSLLSLVISLLVFGVSYAFSQNSMFSPGNLNSQSSGKIIGGISSHAEIETDCKTCHPAPWGTTHMTDLCQACHQEISSEISDSTSLHGAAISEMRDQNCRICHTDHNGRNASMIEFIEEDFPHDLVGFSLKSHQEITWTRAIVCTDCHLAGFRGFTEAVCQDCHGQIDSLFLNDHTSLFGATCRECHDGLETLGVDFDHDQQIFPLDGQHKEVNCGFCHLASTTLENLQNTPTECISCHQDQDGHQGFMGETCETCHTPEDWKTAYYDHNLTGFYLLGGHENLACVDCHPTPTYQGLDPACITCHAEVEPHQGRYGEDCAICHTINNWLEIIFDHAGSSAADCRSCHLTESPQYHYPVQCSLCHSTTAWLPASFDHKSMDVGDCQSCHSGDKPANHYAGQCSICHNTNAWKPASFNHTFPLNHGGAGSNCTHCHPSNNYYSYTCYSCHEHSKSKVQSEHEGVSNLANCIRCHPDGRKHDD
jgi:hypothetical protein